jgi:hypothetical protein
MKAYGGVNVYIHIFFTSALVGGEWSALRPRRFTPGTHWIGGWVDPRAGLDDVEKRKLLTLTELELWPLGRPARSQSLYGLRYVPVEGFFSKLLVLIIVLWKNLQDCVGLAIWLETFEGTYVSSFCRNLSYKTKTPGISLPANYTDRANLSYCWRKYLAIQSCPQAYMCVHSPSQVKHFHECKAEIKFPWKTEVVVVFHIPRMHSEFVILLPTFLDDIKNTFGYYVVFSVVIF